MLQEQGQHAADDHADQQVRQLARIKPDQQGHQQRGQPDGHEVEVDVAGFPEYIHPGMQERLPLGHMDTQDVLHLAGRDQDGGAGGKADDDRVRNKVDQHAEARQAETQLVDAGEKGQCQRQGDEFRCARRGVVTDGRENDDGNRRGRARHQVMGRSEQCRDNRRHHRGIQTILRRQSRDGREGNALGQHDHGAGQAGQQVSLQRASRYQPEPVQKREN